jgi:hypothetical protein
LLSTSDLAGGGNAAASDATVAEVLASDAPIAPDAPDVSNDAEADAGDPDLVGAWSFDTAVGSFAPDLSGNGHDATLVGVAASPDAGVSGAGVEVGLGKSIRVPSLDGPAFPSTGSLSFWLRVDSATAATQGVFDDWDSNRSHIFVRRIVDDAAAMQIAFEMPDAASYVFNANPSAKPSDWTHIVITWDAGAKKAHVFQQKVLLSAPENYVGPGMFVPSEQHMTFGGTAFTGAIDEVRLYRKALSPAEVAALVP